MIHPTAVIDPKAQLDSTVAVGPYVVIDACVTLGAHCVVGPHVHLTGRTTVGAHNRFHSGCVVGDEPQDLKYKGEPTGLRIGEHNIFREHFTVHRSTRPEEETVIGSHNMFMAHSHVGHNCVIGDHVILINAVLLAGHVTVGDRVVMGGGAGVHQFARIGRLAMVAGHASLSKDLPPFTLGRGDSVLYGLNTVGLRRAGFTSAQRLELKKLYHHLFRGVGLMRERIESARGEFTSEASRLLLDFVATSKRGVCADPGARSAALADAAADE
jgi:UDP-N-acetylglucosamine acyltransferase